MTVLEFINHLKHKSLEVTFCFLIKQEYNKTPMKQLVWRKDVGTYMNWINKHEYDDLEIVQIRPYIENKGFYIDCWKER